MERFWGMRSCASVGTFETMTKNTHVTLVVLTIIQGQTRSLIINASKHCEE